MAIGDAIRAGLQLGEAVRRRQVLAEQDREQVKLLQARSRGLEADTQLKMHQVEQAIAHQSRLQQIFGGGQASQAPPPQGALARELMPPPGDIPQDQAPALDLPSAFTRAPRQTPLSQPAPLAPQPEELAQLRAFAARYNPQPPPGDVPQGQAQPIITQRYVPPLDEAEQQAAFLRKYGPGPAGETESQRFARLYGPPPGPQATPAGQATAGTQTTPEPPSVPSGATPVPSEGAGPLQLPALRVTAPRDVPQVAPTPAGQDDTLMLRNLSRAYFLNNQPEPALKIYGFAQQQQQLRDAGTLYRSILSNPQSAEPQRRLALAGLGQALIQAGKVDDAMKLLLPTLPLTAREAIEKTSAGTRDVLLEQMQRGQQPDIAQASRESQRRKVEVSAAQGAAGVRARLSTEQQVKLDQTLQDVWKDDSTLFVDTSTGAATDPTRPYGDVQALQRAGVVKKVSKAQAEKLETAQAALPIVQRVSEYVALLYGPGGVLAEITADPNSRQLLGTKRGIEQLNQTYPILSAAQRYIESNAEGLARALKGVRGPGTEGDVERALKGLPRLEASLSVNVWPPKVDYTLPDTRGTALRVMDDLVGTLNKTAGAILGNSQFRYPGLSQYFQKAEDVGRPGKVDQPLGEERTPTPGTPPPAATQRSVPNQARTMVQRLTPEQILEMSDEVLAGIQSADEVPGLSLQQTNALRLRLARRDQRGR